jgi:hypothetical protein
MQVNDVIFQQIEQQQQQQTRSIKTRCEQSTKGQMNRPSTDSAAM